MTVVLIDLEEKQREKARPLRPPRSVQWLNDMPASWKCLHQKPMHIYPGASAGGCACGGRCRRDQRLQARCSRCGAVWPF